MTKLIVELRNLANVPENVTSACFRPSSPWEIFLCVTCHAPESIETERNIWVRLRSLLLQKRKTFISRLIPDTC
jgi:hypothetical protein